MRHGGFVNTILASWLVAQVWSWTAVPNARTYRIYYGNDPTRWCDTRYVTFDAATFCRDGVCKGWMAEPAGDRLFFVVTAVNEAGESPWAHGLKVTCL